MAGSGASRTCMMTMLVTLGILERLRCCVIFLKDVG